MPDNIFKKASINNVDDDNLYEIIVYNDSGEKVFQCKVSEVHTELLASEKKDAI